MPSGIYKIECTVTGKIYVGSAVNLYRRWHSHHLTDLRGNRHVNRYLQAAWNKYGEAAFTFGHLEIVTDRRKLVAREQHWLDKLRSAEPQFGFNLCAVAASSLGFRHSAEAKRKMAAVHAKTYIVRNPAGRERCISNLFQFCQRHDLTHVAMSRVAQGKSRHHRKWECRYAAQTRAQWLASLTAPPKRPQLFRGKRKHCSRCKRYREQQHFNRDVQQQSGLASYCRDCSRKRLNAAYRQRTQGAA